MFVHEETKTITVRRELHPPEWLRLAMEGKEDEAIHSLRSFCALSGAQARSIVRSVSDHTVTKVIEHSI